MREITPWISLTPLVVSSVTEETKVARAYSPIQILTLSQANQALMKKHHMVSSGKRLERKEGNTQPCFNTVLALQNDSAIKIPCQRNLPKFPPFWFVFVYPDP